MARTWLLAYDFSECAEAAAHEAARDLTAAGGGRLVVVHAFEPPARPAAIDISIGSAAFSSWRDVEEAVVASIRERVEQRVAALAAIFPEVTFEGHTLEGPADQVILAAAEREGAERIVCGTHGRTGLQRFFLGSVAQRIAREALVPVMIVKHRGG